MMHDLYGSTFIPHVTFYYNPLFRNRWYAYELFILLTFNNIYNESVPQIIDIPNDNHPPR